MDKSVVELSTEAKLNGHIKTVEQLLEECKVDLTRWAVQRFTVNKWDSSRKVDKKTVTVPMFQVKANLIRWPSLELVPARSHSPVVAGFANNVGKDTELAVFVPDFQLGYAWNDTYTHLDPFHDRQAIDTVLNFVRDVQPDHIYFLGDFLDLPEYSRFEERKRGMRFNNTTQPAIEEGYYWLRQFHDAVPSSTKLNFLMGNHDVRLELALKKLNEELTIIRPAQETTPSLSFANLLHLDEMGFKYNGGYDMPVWLWDEVCVRHGEEYDNLTAKKLEHSTIQGHCHDIVYDVKTSYGPNGIREIVMMSPGNLCRRNGPIPRFKKNCDWQQGVGVGYKPKGESPYLSVIPLRDGRMYFGNKVYNGETPAAVANRVSQATGVRQFVDMSAD